MAFKSDMDALILGVLQDGALHGYEISKRIRAKSAELFTLGEGQLYPALHRLEAAGSVNSAWEPQEGKPARKVYQLTEAGRTELVRQRKAWEAFSASVGSVLGGLSIVRLQARTGGSPWRV